MTLLLASFIAGILTILAPCVLPLIPVIVGSSVAESKRSYRGLIIISSLGISIFLFTLLLKSTTTLLGVPQFVWQVISGVLLLGIGVSYLFPQLWERVVLKSGSMLSAQKSLAQANDNKGLNGAILTGAALGPVFTSCSPTYLFIVAAILPAEFFLGLTYLIAYIVGLCLVLFVVSYIGKRLISKLGWALNPQGVFRRTIGAIMMVVGLLIILGGDKAIQTWVIDSGLYAPVESLENNLR